MLVFNEHSCIFANYYAKQTLDDDSQKNMWSWYQALLTKQNQGKVLLTINNKQHAFLMEQSYCEIGEQKYVLLVLKQLDSILYQQEKDALKKFVRILSHEINNTLAPIGTVARSLNKRLANDIDKDSFATGLTLINERANYLKSFMDNYVSLAKLPAAQKHIEQCDVLCEQLAAIYPQLAIQCETKLTGFFDISQIKQVLCHLINNALEASVPSPNVLLKVTSHFEHIVFDITDNGPGFSNLEDAGTAFYTTKSGGNGIGLMLSRIIIENHGATLKLQNRTSGGAWVQFSLERVIN